MLVYFTYLDKNPGWVQMAMTMMTLMMRIRLGVNQSTYPCGIGGLYRVEEYLI